MANLQKQNWRYQAADRRWRTRIIWPTSDPSERRIIKLSLQKDQVQLGIERMWRSVYLKGFNPRERSHHTDPRFESDLNFISSEMKRTDGIAQSIKRLEVRTGKTEEELITNYTQSNVKSTCF